MSLNEIEEEMADLRKELKETPMDEQQHLLARLANLAHRRNEMMFPRKNTGTYTQPPHTDEDDNTEG